MTYPYKIDRAKPNKLIALGVKSVEFHSSFADFRFPNRLEGRLLCAIFSRCPFNLSRTHITIVLPCRIFRGNIYAMRNNRSLNTYDVQTAILSNEEVAEAHYLLRCECAEIAQHARPGQFVHVMISQDTGMLLRRPFTIYTVERNEITMLYQIIGEWNETVIRDAAG